MKLALAIVVCIGLYSCAVNAVPLEEIDESEFRRILAFVKDKPRYLESPQTETDGQILECAEKKPGYPDFPQTVNDDPNYQEFVNNNKGHKTFFDFLASETDGQILECMDLHQGFLEDKHRYNVMRKNWEICEGSQRCLNDQELSKITNDFQLYNAFLLDVDKDFKKFLKNAKDPKPTATKYNLLKQPFEGELIKADLDFKLKCILALRTASESSSSSSSSSTSSSSSSSTGKKRKEASNIAYAILEEQLGIFVERLINSVSDVADAKGKMKKISKGQYFLRFFGFWFEPDCNENDLKTEMKKMKIEHNFERWRNVAAKVMVCLKKFDGDKINENYLPTKKNLFLSGENPSSSN